MTPKQELDALLGTQDMSYTAYAAESDHDGSWGVWVNSAAHGTYEHSRCDSLELAEQLAVVANDYGLPSIIGSKGSECVVPGCKMSDFD